MTVAGGATTWTLTLYVSGASSRSTQALETVRRICDEELPGQVDLRVVDVAREPTRVIDDEIFAVPTLVKHAPAPLRRLVGNLADVDRLRAGLDLGPLRRDRSSHEAPTSGDAG